MIKYNDYHPDHNIVLPIRYSVGCGKRNWPGWVSIDGANFPHIMDHDVSLKFQPNNYIGLLYSSHLIAYFDRDQAKQLLSTWFDKIKPGGVLEIATPDFDRLIELYHCGLPIANILGPLYGKMPMGNETIYHKTAWDYPSLEALLYEIGFRGIERYDHTKTCHPNTGDRNDFYDDHSAAYINRTLISLNVRAVKPLFNQPIYKI